MTIHKEGYTSIALTVLFIAILNAVIHFYWSDNRALTWFGYILSAFLLLIILQFFRSPRRKITPDEAQVLCPADGKVVVIEETEETEYFKDKRIQISVFMSPVNVHVNRNPISGIVKYFKYHPGKYLVAWHPKSSTENERTTVVTENSAGIPVLFRQIAGAMARRIVWYVKEGDEVKQGEQFGFIKFGSRVDLFLPLNSFVRVAIGDVVKGGQTIMADLVASAPTVKIETTKAEEQAQAPVIATDVPLKPVTLQVEHPEVEHKAEKVKAEEKAVPHADKKPAAKATPQKDETKEPAKEVKVTTAKEAEEAPVPTEPPAKPVKATAKKPKED
jgi:phosphatidylserine decarboxylase